MAVALQLFLLGSHAWATPVISGFSPTQGKPGTQVVINGVGFSTATIVQFGTRAADFSVSSDTRMVATVPVEARSGPIRVTNPSGTQASSADFVVAPRISGFSPARSATSTPVIVKGDKFVDTTSVLFNNKPASSFTVLTQDGTQIQATVPTGATNGPITVQTPAGSATTTNNFLVIGPAPIIDDFSPRVSAPGVNILIYGVNFTNVTAVKFGGVAASTFSAPAQTRIQAQVPALAKTGTITVTTVAGMATSASDFTVTLKPVVTNFFPKLGVPGTRVIIEGINFTNITSVGFSGKAASFWRLLTASQLVADVPDAATNSGPITVTNASGSGASAEYFVVTRAPLINGFIPTVGRPGDAVGISGANLSNGPTLLKFNGVKATFYVTTVNGSYLQATVPNGATTGPISMTNAYGSFTTSSNFFVTGSAPYVLDLSPNSGPRGAIVLISGGNFNNPVTVRFNGVSSPDAIATTLTLIQATVPANATTGPLTVTTTNGPSTNHPIFYVPPRLTGFSPTNGVVGRRVAIAGANFTNASSVLFNTAAADSFTVSNSNTISAVIPTNAMTGPLTVATPGGLIISTNNFRVQPNITGFSPALGPVGTLVSVLGTSFFNVTNVSFNAGTTNFTVISSTEVRAAVPPAATTGPIRISTPDGTAMSATNFIVTRSSDLAVKITPSATLLKPGQSLSYALLVTNKGPSIVSGVTLSDTLPPGVVLVSFNSSRGTFAATGGIVTFAIGVMTNGTSETAAITVMAPNEAVLTNRATITSVESDLNPADNAASVTTTVVSDASRTLRITLAPSGDNALISWPTSAVPFTLQSLNALSATDAWLPVTNSRVVVGGRNTVTNDATRGNRFFRLQRP